MGWGFFIRVLHHHIGSIECTKTIGVKLRIYIVNILLGISASWLDKIF